MDVFKSNSRTDYTVTCEGHTQLKHIKMCYVLANLSELSTCYECSFHPFGADGMDLWLCRFFNKQLKHCYDLMTLKKKQNIRACS